MVKLLEVFEDIPLKIKTSSHKGKYVYDRTIKPRKYPKKRLVSKLKKHVQELQRRYPKKGYVLEDIVLKGKRYLVIKRREHGLSPEPAYPGEGFFSVWMRQQVIKQLEKEYKSKLFNPPIYYEPATGRFYVPQTYVKRKRRLTMSILHYRLRSLGVI